jgi:hypothetical protein
MATEGNQLKSAPMYPGRILVGIILVILCGWASVAALSLLVFSTPGSRDLLVEHPTALFVAYETIAYLPFVLILSALLLKLFKERLVASALTCVVSGLFVANASLFFETPAYVRGAIGEILFFNCAYLFGVPVTILLIQGFRFRHAKAII